MTSRGASGSTEADDVTQASTTDRGEAQGATPAKRGLFSRIWLFIRQVIAEMRKVVYPTRQELVNYTVIAVVFICVIMAYVVGLDQVFSHLVSWIFGSSGTSS